MRRFEHYEGKFWQVALNGAELTVQHGKVGTVGRTGTQVLASADAAAAAAEKLIREKLTKGYQRVPTPLERMEQALPKLESWLGRAMPAYLAQLRPGRTNFEAAAEALGRPLPPELRALYAWRDGDPSGDGRLVPWRIFRSLDEAVARWTALNAMADAGAWANGGAQPPGAWSRNWFPVLGWDNGRELCVDLEGSYKGPPGRVIEVWLKDRDRVVVAPDLGAWVDVLATFLDIGYTESDGDIAPKGALYFRDFPIRKSVTDKP